MSTRNYSVLRRRSKPLRIPKHVREWKLLYEDGWTLERIALVTTTWYPGRLRQHPGSYSPSAIRNHLMEWGVTLRRPGGRGSIGHSPLVRIAELEQRVRDLEKNRCQCQPQEAV